MIAIFFFLFCVLAAAAIPSPPAPDVPVPVSVTLPISYTVMWVTYIAGGLIGVGVIWRYAMKAAAILTFFKEYLPVLLDIAQEFKSDSGSTLRDSINRMEKAIGEVKESIAEAKAAAALAKVMAEDLRKSVLDKDK